MNWQQKFAKLFSLIVVMMALASCDGNYCVEADEFDSEYIKVKANPTQDGVSGGSYDNIEGGQVANWHETGLRANGNPFLIQISGAWIPWYGESVNDNKLSNLPRCKFCAKKGSAATGNCICYKDQVPTPELSQDGRPLAVDCTVAANQNDATKCSCTLLNGRATDEGVFHFPLNYYKKDHSIKMPDEQDSACKYEAGIGLYLGLFGVGGGEMPKRVYQLFSQATTCPINRNSAGKCIDSLGMDRTKYVFRSANNAIFVKDDLAGNNGTDSNPSDNIYHRPNETVKLIIYDRYYSDNYGQYDVAFFEGVNRDGDTGLLEFLVSVVEDSLLGKKNSDGTRSGGTIKFMYKAIVQDTYFAATLQICLSLYVAFFGMATLLGIVEITKKELLSRLVKLSLVIFFTTPTSWDFYNNIVVSFFKDGMDSVITMFANYVDSGYDENNPIMIAQAVSPHIDSSASRFSYIDNLIKTLFSDNVTKKIWGLFFESFFGFVYIAAIYALIGCFIYVMLLAAMIYVATLLKLIFVLALGPIFIAFSLFAQTNQMFKNWLGFVGARSLEMVILFLVLYTFVMFIDHKFVEMLGFRVCTKSINFGFFSFGILMSEPHRGLISWLQMLLVIGGFIYILKEVVEKIPDFAGNLISISGVEGSDDGAGNNSSAATMAGKAMGTAAGLAGSALKFGFKEGGGQAYRALRMASRASGFSAYLDKVGDALPFRSPKSMLRDNIIQNAISKGKAEAAKKGLKEGTAAFDQEVRNVAYNDPKSGLIAWKHANKKKAALYDMTAETIAKRLDQKLVQEPLKKFLKDEAKKMKEGDANKILLGKDMQKALQEKAENWAAVSLAGGKDAIKEHLGNLKDFMDKHGKLSSKEAAKKFAGNETMKDKFLMYKQQRALEKGKDADNKTGKNFIRALSYEEKRSNGVMDAIGFNTGKGLNPLNRIGFFDKWKNKTDFNKMTDEAMGKALANHLKHGGTADEKERAREYYKGKASGHEGTFYGRQLLGYDRKDGTHVKGKLDKKLDEIEKKRDHYKRALVHKIGAEIQGKSKEELDELRVYAGGVLEDMKKKHFGMVMDSNWKDKLRENGGLEAYRDGLIDFDGNSLFEATARAKALGLLDGDAAGSTMARAQTSLQMEEQYKAYEKETQAKLDEIARLQKEGEMAEAKRKADELNKDGYLLPVEFGINKLNDAIGLQASNFGLEAGNPMLGQDNKAAQEAADKSRDALLSVRNALKTNAQRQAKMKEYEKAFKESELQSLEAELKRNPDDKSIAQKITQAQNEVAKLEREARECEQQAQAIEDDIVSLKNS